MAVLTSEGPMKRPGPIHRIYCTIQMQRPASQLGTELTRAANVAEACSRCVDLQARQSHRSTWQPGPRRRQSCFGTIRHLRLLSGQV